MKKQKIIFFKLKFKKEISKIKFKKTIILNATLSGNDELYCFLFLSISAKILNEYIKQIIKNCDNIKKNSIILL